MTYGHRMPELEVHVKADETPKLKRKKVKIPSMWSTKPKVPRISDETVISIMLRHKLGERMEDLADEFDLCLETIKNYVYGINRVSCQIEAERRFAKIAYQRGKIK